MLFTDLTPFHVKYEIFSENNSRINKDNNVVPEASSNHSLRYPPVASRLQGLANIKTVNQWLTIKDLTAQGHRLNELNSDHTDAKVLTHSAIRQTEKRMVFLEKKRGGSPSKV